MARKAKEPKIKEEKVTKIGGKFVHRRKPNRSVSGDVAIMIMLLSVGVFMLLPFVYAISNSVKPMDELFAFPPRFFARNPTLDNFSDLFIIMSESWVPFSRYIFNTVFITACGTLGHLFLASMAAFALAKHEFPGKNFLFTAVIWALMFPATVTYIPNYLILSGLGWLNTYLALIVPAFASTMGLFLMKQFMEGLPTALCESARIDGANEFRVYWSIAMPNVKPAWLTLIIFSFQSLWNTTGGVYVFSEQLKTLPYALNQILAGGVARQGAGSAVAVFIMIVPIVMFMLTESNVVETMASSGIK